MRAVRSCRSFDSANAPRRMRVDPIRFKRRSVGMLAAVCLIAVLSAGYATTPGSSPSPPVGSVSDAPLGRNYFQRLVRLQSDKDGGVLYWTTYGH